VRRVVTVAAWAAVLLVLTTIALYLALLLQRQIAPPLVPIDGNNELAGYVTGDAVLLRHIGTGQIHKQQLLAVRYRHRNLVGRVDSITIDQPHSRFVITGASRSGPITVHDDDVIGRVDHHLPIVGWVLIAARQRLLQILGGIVVIAIAVLVALGRRIPLSVLEEAADPEPAHEPFALSRTSAAAMDPAVAYLERPMSITPEDLRQVRFAQMRKGYDTEAVDHALDKVADSLEALLRERQQLIERLRTAEAELAKYRAIAEVQQQQPTAAPSAEELLSETRAIRSLLQRVLSQTGQQPPPSETT
jgi:DivIVA domain-containing protein